jgi:membrane-associated phospholipid phosphatase
MLLFQTVVSQIAGPFIMFSALLTVSVLLYKKNDTKEFYKVFFTSTLAMCISYTLKYLFKIPRPDTMLIPEGDYRFPSGHATMAAVVMALGMHYAHTHIKNKSLRYTLYTIAFLWYALVSYSRLYLQVHLLIDVFVGGAIGVFSTVLILKLFKHLRYYK